MERAIKVFQVEAGSTPEMRYQIIVKFKGQVIETFIKDTMKEAIDAFEGAGYKSDECIEEGIIALLQQGIF